MPTDQLWIHGSNSNEGPMVHIGHENGNPVVSLDRLPSNGPHPLSFFVDEGGTPRLQVRKGDRTIHVDLFALAESLLPLGASKEL